MKISLGLFQNVTEKEKDEAVESIIQHATPRKDFFLMLTLSISMAGFGLLLDSSIILIGSMLIAPLLYPLLSLALGVIVVDEKLIGRSIYTLIKSVIYGLVAGLIIGLLFSTRPLPALFLDTGVASLHIMYAVVAAIAGFAAAFAMTKPHLNETLPGVAISVALVPPLASSGLALAHFNWQVFNSSFLIFLINVAGIVFSSMIVFALLKFSVKRTVAKEIVKEEEGVIKKEERAVDAGV